MTSDEDLADFLLQPVERVRSIITGRGDRFVETRTQDPSLPCKGGPLRVVRARRVSADRIEVCVAEMLPPLGPGDRP